MVYLALVPFLLGVLPHTVLYAFKLKAFESMAKQLYNWGVISLTIGFSLKGIVDISGYVVSSVSLFGTELKYMYVYYFASALLLICGVVLYLAKSKRTA